MKPPPFIYHRPESLADALHLLDTLENPKILAGGQSLMPMLNLRYVFPDHIIDLNRVDGLSYIRENGDEIEIGGTTRQRDIELSPLLGSKAPIFAEALRVVGHIQTRNRGTIGGSLCHLDPASELPTIALAYDATISVAGSNGNRTIAMEEFIGGPMTPSIEFNEIVTAIRFSPWPARHGYAFEEFSRRHGDFAIAGVAVLIVLGNDRAVRRVSIAIAGACATQMRLREAEQALIGKVVDAAALDRVESIAGKIDSSDDAYYTAGYRRHLASRLVRRTIERAVARAVQPS